MLSITNHQVDNQSCSTTMNRPLDLPSIASIEELRTPAFEELLNIFRGADYSAKHPDWNNNKSTGSPEAAAVKSLDSRYPIIATQ